MGWGGGGGGWLCGGCELEKRERGIGILGEINFPHLNADLRWRVDVPTSAPLLPPNACARVRARRN